MRLGTLCFEVVLLFAVSASFAQETKESTEADTAYRKGDFVTARELYTRQRERVREPQQREEWKRITTRIVRCSTALADTEQAAQEFFLLCRVDPQTPLDAAPLPWFTPVAAPMTPPREKTAEEWLDPLQMKIGSPAASLLAASILSVSTNNGRRKRGLEFLKNLADTLESEVEKAEKDPNTQLRRQAAQLAGAMLWKQRIPTLRKNDLVPMWHSLEQIPETLRDGPWFLYGRAARQVDDPEAAVLAWMRIPILYPENRPLAAEALREAAQTLDKLGRSDQAATLRREAETLQSR